MAKIQDKPAIALKKYDGTVKDVAILCGVPESTIYRAVAGGRIPAIRLGKHLRFSMSNVIDFLAEEERNSVGN